MGRGIAEFKKATNELKESLDTNTDFADLRQSFDEIQDTSADASSPATTDEEEATERVDTPSTASYQEDEDDTAHPSLNSDEAEEEQTPPTPATEKPSHGDK